MVSKERTINSANYLILGYSKKVIYVIIILLNIKIDFPITWGGNGLWAWLFITEAIP